MHGNSSTGLESGSAALPHNLNPSSGHSTPVTEYGILITLHAWLENGKLIRKSVDDVAPGNSA